MINVEQDSRRLEKEVDGRAQNAFLSDMKTARQRQ